MSSDFFLYICTEIDSGTAYSKSWVGCIYREEEIDLEDYEEDEELPDRYGISFVQLAGIRGGGYIPSDNLQPLQIKRTL